MSTDGRTFGVGDISSAGTGRMIRRCEPDCYCERLSQTLGLEAPAPATPKVVKYDVWRCVTCGAIYHTRATR